jgi:hypothetical protein
VAQYCCMCHFKVVRVGMVWGRGLHAGERELVSLSLVYKAHIVHSSAYYYKLSLCPRDQGDGAGMESMAREDEEKTR